MMIKKKSNLHVKVNELTSFAKADRGKSVEKIINLSETKQRKGLNMKKLIVFLLLALPWALCAQTEADIRKAIAEYNYEFPIMQIVPVCGDSVLTPLRAQALKAMNRTSEALQEWNSLLKSDSTDVKILIELADCYRLTNRTSQAALCYAKAVAIQPENKYFRQQHIRTLLANEDYEAARSASHAFLEKDSLSATGYQLLGMAYEGMAMDNPEELANAFFAYNLAYRRDSLDGQTVAHLASIFNNSEQFEDAISLTEVYRLSDTLHIDVNRQNAKAYCMLKDYTKAIDRYEALKAMGDRTFTTLYYLGISHYGNNWPYGAQENLLEAHKKNPQDVNVLYYLAKSCARSSWKAEAVEYMKTALQLTIPEDSLLVRLYDGLDDCLKADHKSDPYERIEVLKKLYSLNKKYILLYNIASIYDRQKDYANAVYYYEKYLTQVPKNKYEVLDDEGNPIPDAESLYQRVRKRVEKIKAEDFFRNGVQDDYYEHKVLRIKDVKRN